MQTRSMTKQSLETPTLPVVIDFDAASRAWMQNKRKLGQGSYAYIRPKKAQKQ
jgi:hypothetical protein